MRKTKRNIKSSKITRHENKIKEQEMKGTQWSELLISTISNAHPFIHTESSEAQGKQKA